MSSINEIKNEIKNFDKLTELNVKKINLNYTLLNDSGFESFLNEKLIKEKIQEFKCEMLHNKHNKLKIAYNIILYCARELCCGIFDDYKWFNTLEGRKYFNFENYDIFFNSLRTKNKSNIKLLLFIKLLSSCNFSTKLVEDTNNDIVWCIVKIRREQN